MTVRAWLPRADGTSPWPQARALVAGLGSGFSVADLLLSVGADVVVVEDRDTDTTRERATLLETLGATVRLGPGSATGIAATLPASADLVITSPGWRPTHPLLAAAAAGDIPVWGDVELAWRLSRPGAKAVPWLAVTGTNGKTTTVQMLESMITAAGYRTGAFGNIGRPIGEFVLDPDPYDVLVVEVSSFQLHWTQSMRAHSAAVLNLQPDHLEWYPDFAPSASR